MRRTIGGKSPPGRVPPRVSVLDALMSQTEEFIRNIGDGFTMTYELIPKSALFGKVTYRVMRNRTKIPGDPTFQTREAALEWVDEDAKRLSSRSIGGVGNA